MQAANRVKNALQRAAGPSFGLWQMFPDPNVSRILARTPGIDWILVDCEHGNIDDAAMHNIVPAVAATGISPIVRLPSTEPWMIKRALDCGAHGILVPLLRTPQEARDIVKASKFPPQGTRGFGSPFSMERFQPAPTMTEYLQQANSTLLTMVQIETKEALESVEEIAAIDGIDVLFIGPFDLGNNIGHPILGTTMDPELTTAMARILDAAHKAGKKAGVYSATGEQANNYASQGFDFVSAGTDFPMLTLAAAQSVSIAQGKEAPKKGGGY